MNTKALKKIFLIPLIIIMLLLSSAVSFAAEAPDARVAAEASDARVAAEASDARVTAEAAVPEDTVSPAPAATTISGVPARLSKSASAKLSFTVRVSPANGRRTVKLQQYDSSRKKWRTRATYRTKDQSRAGVKVTIAKKYRRKTTGTWRVYVPATDRAGAAVSGKCTVTTRNIRKKKLAARSACIYCVDTGTLLYTRKHTARRSPASTTKLMTAILLVESGKLNKETRISAKAARTPWGSGRLKKGDRYRNIDLLYAMMLPSSNDAAVAVAEGVSGSTDKFVKKMNKKAKEMGLKHTHFCNPHGLNDSGHYTTAIDLARLTACAYDIDEIREAMNTRSRTITSTRYHRSWTLRSSDSLLGRIKNFLGGKTGTGEDARYCFAGIYKYKKKTYVTVVLGAPTPGKRWSDTRKLQSYIRKYAETGY